MRRDPALDAVSIGHADIERALLILIDAIKEPLARPRARAFTPVGHPRVRPEKLAERDLFLPTFKCPWQRDGTSGWFGLVTEIALVAVLRMAQGRAQTPVGQPIDQVISAAAPSTTAAICMRLAWPVLVNHFRAPPTKWLT